jgi:anti-anti-sigma regulatory factor
MPNAVVHDIIRSEKAKTIEQALLIIQHLRANASKEEKLILDFSEINWVSSMFADRLVKALATFYGADFERKLKVTNIEESNVMFKPLWTSAIEKFRHGLAEA